MKAVWHEVTEANRCRWQDAFGGEPASTVELKVPCPICGGQLMRYYQLAHVQHYLTSAGEYCGRGSLWEWCSDCRSFVHATALVPISWKDPQLAIVGPIRIDPGPIDDAVRAKKSAFGTEHEHELGILAPSKK